MEHMSLHAALSFFFLFSFRSQRFGALNVFVCLRNCFVWLLRTLGFGFFFFFFFVASFLFLLCFFTYLKLFCLRYFSYAVFLSAGLHLRYHSVFRRMRFLQLIHLLLQLVEGFGLFWSPVTDC